MKKRMGIALAALLLALLAVVPAGACMPQPVGDYFGYALVDFNQDGAPELVVFGGENLRVYTYENGDVRAIVPAETNEIFFRWASGYRSTETGEVIWVTETWGPHEFHEVVFDFAAFTYTIIPMDLEAREWRWEWDDDRGFTPGPAWAFEHSLNLEDWAAGHADEQAIAHFLAMLRTDESYRPPPPEMREVNCGAPPTLSEILFHDTAIRPITITVIVVLALAAAAIPLCFYLRKKRSGTG